MAVWCLQWLLVSVLVSCGEASLDYNHPDVELFVKQLRTGKIFGPES